MTSTNAASASTSTSAASADLKFTKAPIPARMRRSGIGLPQLLANKLAEDIRAGKYKRGDEVRVWGGGAKDSPKKAGALVTKLKQNHKIAACSRGNAVYVTIGGKV